MNVLLPLIAPGPVSPPSVAPSSYPHCNTRNTRCSTSDSLPTATATATATTTTTATTSGYSPIAPPPTSAAGPPALTQESTSSTVLDTTSSSPQTPPSASGPTSTSTPPSILPSVVVSSSVASSSVSPASATSVFNLVSLPATSAPVISTASVSSSLNTSQSPAAASVLAETPSSSTLSPNQHKSTDTGAIVGGVVGGLFALLALLTSIFFIRRHRRRSRTAPSTEFMNINSTRLSAYSPAPGFTPFDRAASATPNQSLTPNRPLGPPPPFTPGDYHDPLFEKLAAAASQQYVYQTFDPNARHLQADESPDYSVEKDEEEERFDSSD